MTLSREQAARQCAAIFDEKFFRAFSEPARAAVFREVVLHGRADIGTLARHLPQDRSVVSRHLQILAEAGALRTTKEGRHVFYEVDAGRIEHQLQQMLQITRCLRAAGEADDQACAGGRPAGDGRKGR